MFSIAILIGIYSYIIFSLGLIGLLYKQGVIAMTVLYALTLLYWKRKVLITAVHKCFKTLKQGRKLSYLSSVFLLILFVQATINLIGALGPELGFDALWYHLTLPKLYLLNHAVTYIPGNLLYYSAMPKLTEMIYVSALAMSSETVAKLAHFFFGLLSCVALYKVCRKFFPPTFSLVAVLIFYANLVVAWQSITAYVDLARTFFEVMGLWGFLNWVESKKFYWFIVSSVMIGFAISVKLLAFGSLLIFSLLVTYVFIKRKKSLLGTLHHVFAYLCMSIFIALPWFVFSFVHAGNPVYPLFSDIYPVRFDLELLQPEMFMNDIWNVFTFSSDPLSPLYLIFLPPITLLFHRFSPLVKLIAIYSFLALLVWYITPRTGGSRFIMPYLPALSIVAVAALYATRQIKAMWFVSLFLVIVAALISIAYRGVANAKYLPVIVKKESKDSFLQNHLNFSFGDFYDIDTELSRRIEKGKRVLLYGFHNLYYIDFPFLHESWVAKGERFHYIATQHTNLPKRFAYWNVIYENQKTGVKLYSLGGQTWVY